MKDPRYDYPITVSAHIILKNDKKEILLGRRPLSWEWAPGRWGLIGGKVYAHEELEETVKRKTKQELGVEFLPSGLYQIKQLVIKDKQAYMIFFVGDYNDQEIKGELGEYGWFGVDKINKIPANNFSEYFYKTMLTEYLTNDQGILPVSKVQSLNYVTLSESLDYKQWFEGIVNKEYNPEIIPDFQKWKKDKK